MLPQILSEFTKEIEVLKLESVKIKAIPDNDEKSILITESKFLGIPYLPLDYKYPQDKMGKPMILIAQINFSEIPYIKNYPDRGILQFFVSSTDWYDMDDYRIIYHEDIYDKHQTNFSFLTEELYIDSPIYCQHRLEFVKSIEFGGNKDHRFNLRFNGIGFHDFCKTLPTDLTEVVENFFDASGHKIGGYAYFTQSDPRDYNDTIKEDVLLLQIDSDYEIMFGDNGIANIFINPIDLKNKKFEKAWFNWDCY